MSRPDRSSSLVRLRKSWPWVVAFASAGATSALGWGVTFVADSVLGSGPTPETVGRSFHRFFLSGDFWGWHAITSAIFALTLAIWRASARRRRFPPIGEVELRRAAAWVLLCPLFLLMIVVVAFNLR